VGRKEALLIKPAERAALGASLGAGARQRAAFAWLLAAFGNVPKTLKIRGRQHRESD